MMSDAAMIEYLGTKGYLVFFPHEKDYVVGLMDLMEQLKVHLEEGLVDRV